MSTIRVAAVAAALLSLALAGCEAEGNERTAEGPDTMEVAPVRAGPAEAAAGNLRERFLAAETPEVRAGLFTDDGFLLLDETEMLVGREEIRDHYERLTGEPQPVMEFDPIEAEASGSLAIERGRFTQRFRAAGGEDVATVEGKYLLVLRRDEPDGWRIRGAVIQSEEPPPHRRAPDGDTS